MAANTELDAKALARWARARKVEMLPLAQVQPVTGYVRGGVTARGAKREFPVCVDETIELFEVISISAGIRGTQTLIAPANYLRAVGGITFAIARELETVG